MYDLTPDHDFVVKENLNVYINTLKKDRVIRFGLLWPD